jgi:hypothetical protein
MFSVQDLTPFDQNTPKP